ncbi:MAG: gamma-glutamyl-gamma-aminobutyrate hydrolase family protein [Bacillota bacterium]|nr:gamma-glutamyl-gamma-aminobutyrate hydrolase family protein [Bacillota bacterium]
MSGRSKPRIAISPTVHPDYGLRTQRHYYQALYQAGALPLILPLLPGVAGELLALCDGLLLAGGGDVEPARYGEERHPSCDEVEPERDAFEIELLWAARRRQLPLLGVCRGLQLINVAYGGSLWQDVSLRDQPTLDHNSSAADGAARHTLRLGEPRLRALYGGAEQLAVNTMHHQLVRELGAGLIAAAHSADGVIEAACGGADYPLLLAVQWHPERMMDEQRELNWLIEQSQAGR